MVEKLSASALERQMLSRVRTHMLISIAGIVAGVVCMGVVHSIGTRLFGARPPGAFVLAYVPCVLLMPVIGWFSSVRNLRCPNCDGSVVWQTSANASAFAAMSQKTCRHCGKQIFGRTAQRQWRRTFVLVFVFTILLFGSSALVRTFGQ